ncbi:uncharacterized protein KD926_001041 [Aspergillus affinis]|uniref:uncharacterized protein n=1 Tax=Aspergillus affinis TaxID=1070780 RepID=UPI0022FEE327|nr:uncharacterized protein KD926_001041 [Aspergillus affinis]KAI9044440.1 hypothetical protein KD926_001041 [Aspergillus affinis]
MAVSNTVNSDTLGPNAIVAVRWFLPPTAAVYYVTSACIALALGHRQRGDDRLFRRISLCFACIICITYVLSAIFLLHLSISKAATISRDRFAYDANSSFIWFSLLFELSGPRVSPYLSLAGCSILYCVGEVFFFVLGAPPLQSINDPYATIITIVRGFRLTILSLLVTVLIGPLLSSRRQHSETSPLLSDDPSRRNNNPNARGDAQYGAISWNRPSYSPQVNDVESGTDSYLRKTGFLVPFFWPQNKPLLQLLCGILVILMVIERALIFFVPWKLGLAIDSFLMNPGTIPYREIIVFAGLWLLESSGGIPQLCRCLWSPLEEHFCFRIGATTFDKIMSSSGDFHDKTNATSLWETVSQVIGVRHFVRSYIFHVIPTLIDALVALAVLSGMFGMYMAMIFSTIFLAVLWVSSEMLPRLLSRQEHLIRDMEAEHKCLYEATSNWPTVVYFNRIQHEQLRYRSALADLMHSSIAFSLGTFLDSFARSCLLYVSSIGLFLLAAYEIAWENKSVGSFVMLVFYWARLSNHLQLLPSTIRDSALGILNACDLVARLKVEPAIRNQKDAKPLIGNPENLEFRDVSFSYNGEKRVLSHVSFEAQIGQTIALVGPSGSGKSTLSKLLVRMYDPHQGIIAIDGQNIRDVTLESLRTSVGIVSQETIILHDTVMNNMRYANVLASEGQVYDACKEVGLHELFNSLPGGYQTLLGGNGVKLSFGEQQRLAVARVIIKNPKIVFLDEATNSLDRHAESVVLQSLKKLCAVKITFKVSSRLSAIKEADKILVLHHGRLIEQGDHASLLSANGYYASLWSSQVRTKTPTDSSMLTMNKWFSNEPGEMNNMQHLQEQKNTRFAMGPHERLFTDSSSLQRTIWKPDAPEFIPISHRSSAETSGDAQYPILEDQYALIPKQFQEPDEVCKENLQQAILTPTTSEALVSPVDGKVTYYETTDGETGDIVSTPVLQQVDNGVVLAYPRRPRKRARRSKYRPVVRRKLTESEPTDMNFDPGQYQFSA